MDANNATADTFSHASSTQIDNTNTIFRREKLDKSYWQADLVKDLKINDDKYYESDTATTRDAQGDITSS